LSDSDKRHRYDSQLNQRSDSDNEHDRKRSHSESTAPEKKRKPSFDETGWSQYTFFKPTVPETATDGARQNNVVHHGILFAANEWYICDRTNEVHLFLSHPKLRELGKNCITIWGYRSASVMNIPLLPAHAAFNASLQRALLMIFSKLEPGDGGLSDTFCPPEGTVRLPNNSQDKRKTLDVIFQHFNLSGQLQNEITNAMFRGQSIIYRCSNSCASN